MKCYRAKSGAIHPVKMKEDGTLVIYNLATMQPFKNNIAFTRPWGCSDKNFYENACVESPAKTLEEMRKWADKIADARARKLQAEFELAEAERELEMLEMRVENYSYARTKEEGLTWRVWFNHEHLINPKTGNEFFSEEDAKAVYWEQIKTHKQEIEYNGWREDVDFSLDESEDYLDDCVTDEEDGAFDSSNEPPYYYLRHSPEYRKFHDRKRGDFMQAVLDFYLTGTNFPSVEQYEIKASGIFNGKQKQYTITGNDKGRFEIIRPDKKRRAKD